MKRFKKGDHVLWTYRHFTGSAYIHRVKTGTFVRYVNSRVWRLCQAVVHFDGNKTDSTVPCAQLEFVLKEISDENEKHEEKK